MVRRIKSSTILTPQADTFTAEDIVDFLKQIPELTRLPISATTTPQGRTQFAVGNHIYDAITGASI